MRRHIILVTALLALGVPALWAAPAHALSCVGAETVLHDAESVFAGRIVDARDGKIAVEVTAVYRGEVPASPVWLPVELPEWSEWSEGHGAVPDGYSSPKTWVFAPRDSYAGPCNSWAMSPYIRSALRGEGIAEPIWSTVSAPEATGPTKPASVEPSGSWTPAAVGASALVVAGALLAWGARRRARRSTA